MQHATSIEQVLWDIERRQAAVERQIAGLEANAQRVPLTRVELRAIVQEYYTLRIAVGRFQVRHSEVIGALALMPESSWGLS